MANINISTTCVPAEKRNGRIYSTGDNYVIYTQTSTGGTGGGTAGVTTFNTRSGAVSLTCADVTSVLTGLVASHTHSYGTGTVTSVAVNAPLTGATITGSGSFGIRQANTSQSGYLSSTDWNTFNGKQPAGAYLTGVKVDTFNGKSGTVTLCCSEITALLTGVVTSHSHAEATLALTDITTCNASSLMHGFLPKLANTGVKFLRDDGTWQTAAAAGVTTFNSRSGAVTLTSSDVMTAYTGITSYNSRVGAVSSLFTDICGLVISGYVVGANTPITFSDTVLSAYGKLQGQINARGVGTVTSVTAGAGLTQSGTATINPTIDVVSAAGTAGTVGTLTITADAIGVTLGTTSTSAAAGNHTHSGAYQPAAAGLDNLATLSASASAGCWLMYTGVNSLVTVNPPVSTFNTRTGTVTLQKADVEGVLTGTISTHTHAGIGSGSYLFLTGGTMSNTNLVTNMNAQYLNGVALTSGGGASNGGTWNAIPYVKSDGVMEIGTHLDFHQSASDATDNSVRLSSVSGVLCTSSSIQAGTMVCSPRMTLSQATGTAPFITCSTTMNTNLNADMVDGKHASDFGSVRKVYNLPSAIASVAATETVIMSTSVAAGAVGSAGDTFRITLAGNSSSTGTLIFRVRVGVNGTIADTQAWISTTSVAQVANAHAGVNLLLTLRNATQLIVDGNAHAGAVMLPTLIGAPSVTTFAPSSLFYISVTVVSSTGTFTSQVGNIELVKA